MKNRGLMIAGGLVLVLAIAGGAFWGGTMIAGRGNVIGAPGAPGALPGGEGGPMAQLSDADREKLQRMTPEEAREFMQERRGDDAPGGPRGGVGAPSLSGEVVSVDGDTLTLKLTSGGSATVYLKDDTVTAFARGVSEKELVAGDAVIVIAVPAAESVMDATLVVVTR